MSREYSVTSQLYKEYSQQNIIEILKKGEKIGFTYYEFIPGEYEIKTPPFTIEEASAYILTNNNDQLPWMLGKINDTYITIHFIKFTLGIAVMFNNFTYPWLKNFDGMEDVDIGKYTRLMLELIEDCRIFKLIVEKD